MNCKLFLALFLFGLFVTGIAQDLAIPQASTLDQTKVNNVNFPFHVEGNLDNTGVWEANVSTVKGSLHTRYNIPGSPGKYGQEISKSVKVGINGAWEMEGFELYPPDNAYNIEYIFDIFHHHNNRESYGRAYRIIPSNNALRKFGILKLGRKKDLFVKPIPRVTLEKFKKVKFNPKSLAPKTK